MFTVLYRWPFHGVEFSAVQIELARQKGATGGVAEFLCRLRPPVVSDVSCKRIPSRGNLLDRYTDHCLLYSSTPSRWTCFRKDAFSTLSYKSRSTLCGTVSSSIAAARRAWSVVVRDSPNNAMSTSEPWVKVCLARDPNSTARSTRSLERSKLTIAPR